MTVVDQTSRIEYEVTAPTQDTFVYPFRIFQKNDILVFQNGAQLTVDIDYTLTNIGNVNGGNVVLTVAAVLNDVIILDRDLTIERDTDFEVAGEFTAAAINRDLDRITMISQDIDTKLDFRGLTYNVEDDLADNRAENILPQLNVNSPGKINVWSRAAGGGIIAVELDENGDANTLRSELAVNATGPTSGANLVGHFGTIIGASTVQDTLARLQANTTTTDGASLSGYFGQAATTSKTIFDNLSTEQIMNYVTSGTASAYTITTPTPYKAQSGAYNDKILLKVRFHLTNNNNPTINIDGLGAIDIHDADELVIAAGYLKTDTDYLLSYYASGNIARLLTHAHATENNLGFSKIATQADVNTGTNATRYVTSATLRGALTSPVGFVYWNGSTTPVLQINLNFASVTWLGSGEYQYTFTNPMANTNYSVVFNADEPVTNFGSLDDHVFARTVNGFKTYTATTSGAVAIKSGTAIIYGTLA